MSLPTLTRQNTGLLQKNALVGPPKIPLAVETLEPSQSELSPLSDTSFRSRHSSAEAKSPSPSLSAPAAASAPAATGVTSGVGTPPPKPRDRARKFDISAECYNALYKHPKERDNDDIRLINALTLDVKTLAKLSPFARKELCRAMFYEKYDANHTLFEEGDEAGAFFIVLDGSLEVKKKEGDQLVTVAWLSSGDVFGELGLMNEQKKRAATVVTREPTELLRLEKEDYAQILLFTHEKELQEKLELLHSFSIFRSWPRSSLSALSDVMQYKTFMPNKVVIKQGTEPKGIYFIKRGEAKVVKEIEFCKISKRTGQEKRTKKLLQISTLRAGDYFGEVAVLTNGKRTATVISETKLETLFLGKLDFSRRVTGKTLEMMKEYAARYPTDEDIKKEYYEQKKWENFKKKLVSDILKEKKARKASLR